MRKLILSFSLVVLMVFGLSAQKIVIEYAEGSVEFMVKSKWQAVEMGTSYDAVEKCRLGKGAILIFSSGKSSITISKAGVFTLADIIADSEKAKSGGKGNIIAQKMKALDGTRNKENVASGGVRASDAKENAGKIPWAEEDSPQALYKEAVIDLRAGKNKDARDLVNLALAGAGPDEAVDIRLNLTKEYVELGRAGEALPWIKDLSIDMKHPRWEEGTLLTAQVQLEAMMYDQAIKTCVAGLTGKLQPGARDTLLLIKALAEQANGDKTNARKTLAELAKSNDKDMVANAQELQKNL